MAEYYAVERSPEYLAHYGVKGMRWGVRKAIESGNNKRLDRNYKKAMKKLSKLNDKADIAKQTQRAEKFGKAARAAGKVGAVGLGVLAGSAGAYRLSKFLGAKHMENRANAAENAKNALDFSSKRLYDTAADHYKELANKHFDVNDALYKVHHSIGPALVGGTAGVLGYAASAKIKSKIAKNRTTAEGHAKAVAKRNAWKQEMNKAFAGTKYGKKKRK